MSSGDSYQHLLESSEEINRQEILLRSHLVTVGVQCLQYLQSRPDMLLTADPQRVTYDILTSS